MLILVACEESQAVTMELRTFGHEAWSCDLLPCSGGHPGWHYQLDVRKILEGQWDMVIAFPPCTHLCASGARWFAEKRKDGRQRDAIDFFMEFTRIRCPRVAIENPVGVMSRLYRRPDQVIQPWMFGHGETKKTCLWLKGLPPLLPDRFVAGRRDRIHRVSRGPDRSMIRSKTYPGIAKAMAL